MDVTNRRITKIAREVNKLVIRAMKETGIGSGELDLIHAVRHSPGASQREIGDQLNMDKGAVARRAASLEKKGYLIRRASPEDGRARMLFATEKAESLKCSKAAVETAFYELLLEELTEEEQETFASLLDRLYRRAKAESRSGFPSVSPRLEGLL